MRIAGVLVRSLRRVVNFVGRHVMFHLWIGEMQPECQSQHFAFVLFQHRVGSCAYASAVHDRVTFTGSKAAKFPVFWNLDPRRTERVSESIREELDEIIGYEMSDPRVGSACVSEVHLSPDFRRAHIRLTLAGTVEEQTATLDALSH